MALVRDALRLLGVLVTYPVSRHPVRPLADEAMRSLPGDDLVADDANLVPDLTVFANGMTEDLKRLGAGSRERQ